MKAEAVNAIAALMASRQSSWVMRNKELETLLITAYCKGHKAGVDKSVAAFAPESLAQYNVLVR